MQLGQNFFVKSIRRLSFLLLLTAILGACSATWWLTHNVSITAQQPTQITIPLGSSAQEAAQAIVQAGIDISPTLLSMALQLSGKANAVKAGNYRFEAPISAQDIIKSLVEGKQDPNMIRFIEGETFAQIRQKLATNPNIRNETGSWSEAQIMQALGLPGKHAEGRFFPDTYHFHKGASDLEILRQASTQMKRKLEQAWIKRQPDLPYTSPYEALIMASIIEKETGLANERPLVAAVFVNRLRRGMRLQTDPSVIYGLGKSFNGNLTKKHLEKDNPYNTYTRAGLPPSPISAPGIDALLAATRPAKSSALYFVAKGDGSSYFSKNLSEHNHAVRKYQLK